MASKPWATLPSSTESLYIPRTCAGGCGATILYLVDCSHLSSSPEVYPVSGNVAFRGGHLCHSCDMKIGDALRG